MKKIKKIVTHIAVTLTLALGSLVAIPKLAGYIEKYYGNKKSLQKIDNDDNGEVEWVKTSELNTQNNNERKI